MLPHTKPIMAEAFEQFIAENADRRFELINGEIVEKLSAQLQALIASLFSGLLFIYQQKNPIIWIFSKVHVKLPDDNSNDRIPDIAVVLKEGRQIDPDAPLDYMPDLAIEIQSPGQSDKLMSDKADYYLANGTRMVWIIYKKRIVEVRTKDDRQLLNEDDILDGGDLLPGFSVAIKDVFQQ